MKLDFYYSDDENQLGDVFTKESKINGYLRNVEFQQMFIALLI